MERRKQIVVGIAALALILIAIFIVRPGFIGYTVYGELKAADLPTDSYKDWINDMERKVQVLSTNLSGCHGFNDKLFLKVDEFSKKSAECIESRATLTEQVKHAQSKIDDLENEVKDCEKTVKNLEDEIKSLNSKADDSREEVKTCKEQLAAKDDWKERHDALAKNAAKSICCKKKVDDHSIDSYSIKDNVIRCSSGGDFTLVC